MRAIEAIKTGSELLKKNKILTHVLDAELLLSKTLSKSREEILINLDKTINDKKFFYSENY